MIHYAWTFTLIHLDVLELQHWKRLGSQMFHIDDNWCRFECRCNNSIAPLRINVESIVGSSMDNQESITADYLANIKIKSSWIGWNNDP